MNILASELLEVAKVNVCDIAFPDVENIN